MSSNQHLLFTVPRHLLAEYGSSVSRDIDQYLRQRLRKGYNTEEDFATGDVRVYAWDTDPYLRHMSERGVSDDIRLSCGYRLAIRPLPPSIRPKICSELEFFYETKEPKKEERIAKKKAPNPLLLLL